MTTAPAARPPQAPRPREELKRPQDEPKRPREETTLHTRLLKCALEVDDARAFWFHAEPTRMFTAQQAFEEYWFGARSLPRIEVLLHNLRARFSTYPAALSVLHRWREMSPDTRRLICHWHLQLSDPLYRRFTAEYLVERRNNSRAEVTRALVIGWVGQQGPGRWTMSTRIQFASKLLSAAFSAGLLTSNHDPRPLHVPRVPDEALEYLLYLLRETDFEGSLLDNPYLRSVGLDDTFLTDRLRQLPSLSFKRQGDLIDLDWLYPDLQRWADARIPAPISAPISAPLSAPLSAPELAGGEA